MTMPYAAKTQDVSIAESAREITVRVLESITQGKQLEKLRFRLWDGSYWPNREPSVSTVVLNRPSALKEMLLRGTEAALGEAYIQSAFDIEGDTEAAFEFGNLVIESTVGWSRKLKCAYLLDKLPDRESEEESGGNHHSLLNGKQHSLKRDREAIRFHYDVSNDFYAQWLDSRMVYSCACFTHPAEDLESAQLNKLDLICRKLGLQPGDRLLDIGCGWGGLLLHAAANYGVQAEGVTLSQNQLELARQRIQSAGLQDRVSVTLRDYRELKEFENYAAIASVGMVEHVGRKNLCAYFNHVSRLLRPGGLFLNHGIGLGPVPLPSGSGSFIDEFVFPDSELVPIGEMVSAAENARLEIRDVESLREHYALTLRHWVKRLESRREDLLDCVTYRLWRLYMASCEHGFKIGQLSVYQTLLAKLETEGRSDAPFNRRAWYGTDGASASL
jgi:cyclopropane-fatty-acyl-phospholipid synthase